MNDDVLVVAVSPDGKHIAVALLDCTVKVSFFFFFWLECSLLLFLHHFNLFMPSSRVSHLQKQTMLACDVCLQYCIYFTFTYASYSC